ncbi:hypothetical protein RJZ56_001400 [Blastomyces dermatitidis]|uniref:Succinate dehydrogenase assembly factor 4, mitochondrial n=3 Tax=Blastomyces TaxID=229219 RepID=A0A179US35_BLAGS|nr:FMP21 protein [Blastomyces gilchristii SLH14081]XP_045274857.1 FMP21 protein [Blastomyces dermatitidis ER-3]EGE77850.1 FMP21 [Blastomyces dermatitidis ATCC 18188]EQL38141.1 hypothetical protein BDFG_00520 [Blastomyces dermatitidis ATCC 26199]EEQ87560.1 FMP21 protein [Blastomyces dermatitidis ER-3]OAT09877.1 FMP21 protein [Blastomyces gilchristii SLH14081]
MVSPLTLRHLRSTSAVLRTFSHPFRPTRAFSTGIQAKRDDANSQFGNAPSPPRLPKEEQEIFENLQKQSTGAFSTPRSPPQINQSPQSADSSSSSPPIAASPQVEVSGSGENVHPDLFRGAKPEFDGETNPKTGEVGGPKNEPLRWGAKGDWSFNGRVTDF